MNWSSGDIMKDGDFEYEVILGKARITKYTGSDRKVVIPERVGDFDVDSIGPEIFFDSAMTTEEVEVPGTIGKIKDNAFAMSFNLQRVILHEGVKKLGASFIAATAVSELKIPASVTRIKDPGEIPCTVTVSPDNPYFCSDGFGLYAREGEAMTLLTVDPTSKRKRYCLSRGTTAVADCCFEDRKNIKALSFPASLETIGRRALINITPGSALRSPGITEIDVDSSNPVFYTKDGCLYKRQADGVSLVRCFNPERKMVPEKNTVTIEDGAFELSNVEEITIPRSVEKIGKHAFYLSEVTRAVLEDDGTVILFPGSNSTAIRSLLEHFGEGGGLYDFTAYDDFIHRGRLSTPCVEMALNRLRYPRDLTPEDEAYIRSAISDHIVSVVNIAAKDNAIDVIRGLCEQKLFPEDQIGACIDLLRDKDRMEMMAQVMAYKNENFGADAFDFSL